MDVGKENFCLLLTDVRMLEIEPKIFHMLGKFPTTELHCIPQTL